MLHVFAHEFDKTVTMVQRDFSAYINAQINDDPDLIRGFLADRNTDLFDYVANITSGNCRLDLLSFYLLCKMYDAHGAVITENYVWYTFMGDGSLDECRVVLIFMGANRFRDTCPLFPRKMVNTITFEAGFIASRTKGDHSLAADDEKDDPTFDPYPSRASTYTGRRRKPLSTRNTPKRKAARISARKTKKSYYNDPDYVVDVNDSSSSSDNNIAETEERVIGTITIPADCDDDSDDNGTSDNQDTEEYEVSDFPGIISWDEYLRRSKSRDKTGVHKLKSTIKTTRKVTYNIPSRTIGIPRRKKVPYKCMICRKIFTRKSVRDSHVINAHGKIFKCGQCLKKFRSQSHLHEHIKRHIPTKRRFKCDECGMDFVYPSQLDVHKQKHSDKPRFKCDVKGCGLTYQHKSDLSKHIRLDHTVRPMLQCPHCVQQFKGKKLLNQHVKSHQPPTIPCDVCGKMFRHYGSRDSHRKKCVLTE